MRNDYITTRNGNVIVILMANEKLPTSPPLSITSQEISVLIGRKERWIAAF